MLRDKKQLAQPLQLLSLAIPVGVLFLAGCEVDSFFDPSKTGYFETSPTTMPILDRIDVIEEGSDKWSDATDVTPADLLPSDLEYRLSAGDALSIQVQDFPTIGSTAQFIRRVDQAGNIRLPAPVRSMPAAGLTPSELEDALIEALRNIIVDPYVNVNLEEGRGFTYTIEGSIAGAGIFTLTRPDFRLSDALAGAGGVPFTSELVYVIRPVPLTAEMMPFEGRESPGGTTPQQPPANIDDLIEQLDQTGAGRTGGTSPGVLNYDGEPIIDIEDFAPSSQVLARAGMNDSFVFVEERGEWVRVRRQDNGQDLTEDVMPGGGQLMLQRIIKIPVEKYLNDSSYNIVVRPGDRIYVDPPMTGVIYLGGEVFRPGVFNLPTRGHLTLSQLVTAAGGPAPLAIPDRVDLTRRIGPNREATIRVSLAAIRQRNEPDIFLKPDDHIILGTNWVASPLAVMRSGFRTSYGFGFLLDRNFGNDVFGAPPSNNRFGN